MNTHPGEGFSILMQTALIGGIVFALPVIIYQIWIFLSPEQDRTLEPQEQREGDDDPDDQGAERPDDAPP